MSLFLSCINASHRLKKKTERRGFSGGTLSFLQQNGSRTEEPAASPEARHSLSVSAATY